MASQNLSSLISSIHKSRVTVLQLMKKQGYNVDDYSNFSINEVNSMKQNNQLDMLLEMKYEHPVTKRKNKIYHQNVKGHVAHAAAASSVINVCGWHVCR